MPQFLLLLAFLALSTVSYFVGDTLFWLAVLAVSLVAILCIPFLRRQYRRFAVLAYLMSFTLAVSFLMNYAIDGIDSALLYTVRLAAVSVLSISFCICYRLERLKIALIYALRPVGIFSKETYFRLKQIIQLGITLIPLVSEQFSSIARAFKSKGFALTPRAILKRPTIFINVLVYWMLDFTTELEYALIAKGVQSHSG